MTDVVQTAHSAAIIAIHVNAERVHVGTRDILGSEIKKAAIEQGVDIKLDYDLWEEVGHHRTRLIGDDETVQVSDSSRFLADVATLTIEVNYRKVVVEGRRQTGLSIKEAAVAQGVKIKLDFLLYEIVGPGKTKQIQDQEVVAVRENSKFDAVPDDDHS